MSELHAPEPRRPLERTGEILDQTTELLFLLALFLLAFKAFWSLVAGLTGAVLDVALAWPRLPRVLAVLGLGLVVALPAYLLFGDEERPGWLVLAGLRKRPAVERARRLVRKGSGVLASFAFLKLVWLSSRPEPDGVDWWHLVAELLRRF